MIKSFDFLGEKFTFEDNNSARHKTIEGAIISLLASISILVISVIFGREIYERKNAIVSTSQESIKESTVDISAYPLAIAFTDVNARDGGLYEKYFDFVVQNLFIDAKSNVTIENYSMDKCVNQIINYPSLQLDF